MEAALENFVHGPEHLDKRILNFEDNCCKFPLEKINTEAKLSIALLAIHNEALN